MRETIEHLEDMSLSLTNLRDWLRGESWPSESLRHMANDVIVWLGMTINAAETLRGLLEPLEKAKAEVKEAIKEEEGGEVLSEQVQQPEGGEAGPEVPPQEPTAGALEGPQRVRKRKG